MIRLTRLMEALGHAHSHEGRSLVTPKRSGRAADTAGRPTHQPNTPSTEEASVSTEDHATPTGEHPNARAISGLLAIAEFLTQHPELPAVKVFVHGRADNFLTGENPRETLTAFAEALDCRVSEEVSYSDVILDAQVSDHAHIVLRASLSSLGGRPRPQQYDYEPITEACSACGGEPLTEPDENGQRDACPKCEGAATQIHQPVVTAADFERRAA